MLDQQIADLDTGHEASPQVDVKRLSRLRSQRPRDALRRTRLIPDIVRDELTA